MSKPYRYEVGDEVVITPECLERMRSSNRSTVHPNYPNSNFIASAEKHVGVVGTITHTFLPGYEVTARFGEQHFHMKDNWIEPAQK